LLLAAAGFFDDFAGFDDERLRAARASVAKKFPLINTLAPVSNIPTAARRLKRMKAPHSLPVPLSSLQHLLSKRRESMHRAGA
jgi:hypothetical protein